MTEVVMPRLSDSMEEGTILRWLKEPGQTVRHGDPLVEIETDKANMTYESDAAGVLEIVAQAGETLAIGELIAHLRGADERTNGGNGGGDREGEREGERGGEAPAASPAAAAGVEPAPRVKASPVARRMARELQVDIAAVSGTGPGSRVVRADVERAATASAGDVAAGAGTVAAGAGTVDPGTAKGASRTVAPTRTQQAIARRMAESKATIPDFSITAQVDMAAAAELRRQLGAMALEAVPSYNDMAIRACALALREHPLLNASYRDGSFEFHERVNVGIAVATDDALIVPTVFDADRKGLEQIAVQARALTARVRSGEITPPELSGQTFTVSNLGMYGVRSFTPIISSPQAAILAVGEVAPRAVVRDGELVVRETVHCTLVCDHRIVYGAQAAAFLGRVRELLEQPLGLVRSL